jgi:hypothetical protein
MPSPSDAVPRRLVSVDALASVGRARALATARRYRAPAALAARLDAVRAAGADALCASPAEELRAALDRLAAPFPVVAVLPNMPRYVRDASDLGLVGAALRRLRAAGPATALRVARTAAAHAVPIVRGEFAGLLPVLLELERAGFRRRAVRAVVLAAPLTDLLLAAGNAAFFRRHVAFVRRALGVPAGFDTLNLGHLLARFAAWDVAADFVVGPLNARGFLMKPSPAEVVAAVAAARVPVLARYVTAGGVLPAGDGVAWAEAHGAAGVVLDLAEIDDATTSLQPLFRRMSTGPSVQSVSSTGA